VTGDLREPARMSLADPVPATQTFTCPRCETEVDEAWYGPCRSCRAELRGTVMGEARDVAVDYEPKMNVTPNAVATKD
jgi:hypothetical protein